MAIFIICSFAWLILSFKAFNKEEFKEAEAFENSIIAGFLTTLVIWAMHTISKGIWGWLV